MYCKGHRVFPRENTKVRRRKLENTKTKTRKYEDENTKIQRRKGENVMIFLYETRNDQHNYFCYYRTSIIDVDIFDHCIVDINYAVIFSKLRSFGNQAKEAPLLI